MDGIRGCVTRHLAWLQQCHDPTLNLPLPLGGLVTGHLTSASSPAGLGWWNVCGYLRCHAQEFPTIIDVELRQHNAAVLNVSVAQAICQMPPTPGEFDTNNTSILFNTPTQNQALPLQTIESRGNSSHRGGQRLGDAPDRPDLFSGQNLEKADVVCVKIGVYTSCQQAWLDPELTHQS